MGYIWPQILSMEGAKRTIASDLIAQQILDRLYFPEPLEQLYEETDAPPSVVRDVLIRLVDAGMVSVLEYDKRQSDWLPTAIFDKDNLLEYRFVITRKGLMVHNLSAE